MNDVIKNEIQLQIMAGCSGQRPGDVFDALRLRADAIRNGDRTCEPQQMSAEDFDRARPEIAAGLEKEALSFRDVSVGAEKREVWERAGRPYIG